MDKYEVGFTTGVFDLFHVGHLNLLKNAKAMCKHLIVGVTTDDEVLRVKNRKPVIPFNERIEIVQSLKYVDEAVPDTNVNKIMSWQQYRFNAIFKGDDWKGSIMWVEYEKYFTESGVDVIYFPYTRHTSSTRIREVLDFIYSEAASTK